jgi:hypothetical protein
VASNNVFVIAAGSIALCLGLSALTAWGVSTSVLPGIAAPTAQPGFPGDAGADGTDGTPGATGTNGTDGATGLRGVGGAEGSTGLTGPQGATGPAGPQGSPGSTGSQGARGDTGLPGPGPSALTSGPSSGSATLPSNGEEFVLASIAAPAGTFVYSIQGTLSASDLEFADQAFCYDRSSSVYVGNAPVEHATAGVAVTTTAGTVDLVCRLSMAGSTPSGSTGVIYWTDLTLLVAPIY